MNVYYDSNDFRELSAKNKSINEAAARAGLSPSDYLYHMNQAREELIEWHAWLKKNSFNAGKFAGETVPQFVHRMVSK